MIDLNQFMRRVQADKLYVKKEELDELLKGSMQSVTYAELKSLRDNGQLVAGRQYRITDYVTTTTQENTRSAGHQFDIIVTADSESVLNENARAIQHEEIIDVDVSEGGVLKTGAVTKYYDIYEDVGSADGTHNYKSTDVFVECRYAENNEGETVPVLYKTDVGMMEEGADYADTFFYVGRYEYNGETYDRWRKIEENELGWDSEGKIYSLTNIIVDDNGVFNPDIIVTKMIDPYFANAKLSAWELKYCLDNDKTRFAWADEDGKGIIYYMKDEYDNECPYDFKNIQYKRWYIEQYNKNPDLETANTNGAYLGNKDLYGYVLPQDAVIDEENWIWCYTFTGYDAGAEEYYDVSTHPHRLSEETIQQFEDDGSCTLLPSCASISSGISVGL